MPLTIAKFHQTYLFFNSQQVGPLGGGGGGGDNGNGVPGPSSGRPPGSVSGSAPQNSQSQSVTQVRA